MYVIENKATGHIFTTGQAPIQFLTEHRAVAYLLRLGYVVHNYIIRKAD